MEIKVGDYVRTKSNGIQKIDEEGRINLGLIKPPFHIIKEEELLKSSPNIIDLIEVGDYVNGSVVDFISFDKNYYGIEGFEGMIPKCSFKKNIKSIVTKEQFKAMEYKINE